MTTTNVSDAHAKAAATAAREAWEATQAELTAHHADAAAMIDGGTYTDRAAFQMVFPANHDHEAEVSERVIANTIHCINSPVSGQPLSATNHQVEEMGK